MSLLRISASLNRLEKRDASFPTAVASDSTRRGSPAISVASSPVKPYACVSAIRAAAAMRGIAIARRPRARAAPPRASAMSTVRITVLSSYLDGHDPLDGQRAHHEQGHSDSEGDSSVGCLEQRRRIAGVEDAYDHEQRHRQGGHDPP